jgi:hypothetical protein
MQIKKIYSELLLIPALCIWIDLENKYRANKLSYLWLLFDFVSPTLIALVVAKNFYTAGLTALIVVPIQIIIMSLAHLWRWRKKWENELIDKRMMAIGYGHLSIIMSLFPIIIIMLNNSILKVYIIKIWFITICITYLFILYFYLVLLKIINYEYADFKYIGNFFIALFIYIIGNNISGIELITDKFYTIISLLIVLILILYRSFNLHPFLIGMPGFVAFNLFSYYGSRNKKESINLLSKLIYGKDKFKISEGFSEIIEDEFIDINISSDSSKFLKYENSKYFINQLKKSEYFIKNNFKQSIKNYFIFDSDESIKIYKTNFDENNLSYTKISNNIQNKNIYNLIDLISFKKKMGMCLVFLNEIDIEDENILLFDRVKIGIKDNDSLMILLESSNIHNINNFTIVIFNDFKILSEEYYLYIKLINNKDLSDELLYKCNSQ